MRIARERPLEVYKNGKYLGHFHMVVDAARFTGEHPQTITRYLDKTTKHTISRKGYLYTEKLLTKEEIDELMPTTHKNLETTADEQGDFYLERDRQKRKKQLETYICTHLHSYWESLPKEMAKLDRQLLKALLDSI